MNDNTPDIDQEEGLSYYLDIMSRRRWVVLSVLVIAVLLTALITINTRPVYQAQSLLIIEKERGNNGIAQGGPMVERGDEDYYQTQYKLLKSESLLKMVYTRLNLAVLPEFEGVYGYMKLMKPVDIVPVPRSRLVYVRADSFDPQLAARIANTVAAVFIEQNLSNQLFISKDVLTALQGEKTGAGSRAVYDSLPAVVNNVLIQQLKKDAAQLQAQMSEASGHYTAKHPQIMAMASNLRTLQNQIEAETNRVVQSLKIDLSGQLMGNNVRLIDAAVPPIKPIRPNKWLNALLALFGGLLFGMFTAVLVEFIDQTVRTQEDVEEKLGMPFLGMVPLTLRVKGKSAYNHMLLKEHSLVSESIRNLRAMVDFAEVGQKSKSFMVTSSGHGEGKSYVCANLAAAFAQAGERVLLIDTDLRRATQHKIFSLSNSKGLGGFLAGGHDLSELSPLIQLSDVNNLSVLVCGPHPPNPAELLNTPRLAAALTWARERYTRVVVDCPPLFPINDALLVGKHINNCVFVTAYGKTRMPLIKTVTKRLLSSGVTILGLVVNMAKSGGLAYSHSGYDQYNYNYGPETPEKQ